MTDRPQGTTGRMRRWLAVPDRLRESFRRHGVVGSMRLNACHRLRKYGWHQKNVMVVALNLENFAGRYPNRKGSYEIREVSAEDLVRYPHGQLDEYGPLFERWLGLGDKGFVAIKNGGIIGFVALMEGPYVDDMGLRIEVPSGDCKVRDIYVAPRYRRTIVAGLLTDAALEFACRQGFRRVLGSVNVENRASARNCALYGCREIQRLRRRQLLYWFGWTEELFRADTRKQPRPLHGEGAARASRPPWARESGDR